MTDLPLPLSPDQIDELLSADIDGEFDAAAVDLGLDPADARARLAATAGVSERRAALSQVHDLVAAVPELDELTAARVRSRAIEESAGARADAQRRRHRGRRLGIVGGIAAAFLLVVGVVAAVQNSDSEPQFTTASGGAPALKPDAAADATSGYSTSGSLGAFATFDDLAARARASSITVRDSAPDAVSAGSANPSSVPPSSEGQELSLYDANADRGVNVSAPKAVRNICSDEALATAGNPPLVSYGTATVAGTPVVVWVAGSGDDAVVVVLDEACHVVSRQPPADNG
jgi:hypothetical protein